MRLVLLGPPGCGKGTQAVLIRDKCNIPQISTGDLLRTAVREGSELGKKASEYMDAGRLLPDDLIVDLMKERLAASDCTNGYILDGFPRTIKQAEALDQMLKDLGQKIDSAISIDVADEEVVKRITGRRQCPECGEGYHVEFKKPSKDMLCDKCEMQLCQRGDDKEDTVRERLKIYRDQTEPLLGYYKNKGLLRSISGQGSIEKIFERISSLIS